MSIIKLGMIKPFSLVDFLFINHVINEKSLQIKYVELWIHYESLGIVFMGDSKIII
ncbi:MAG: hypothetical protein QXS19_04135 [Candidatus Methanomethylicia archaeon]